MDFLVGQGLDRMFDENEIEVGHAQGIGLGASGIGKLGGRKRCHGNTGFFKEDAVVHTARGAGASIRQRFNDDIALLL